MKIDWLKYKALYFLISGTMIVISIFSIAKYRFNLGVDFTGGVVAEYKFEQTVSTEDITHNLEASDIELSSIQKVGENSYLFRFGNISDEQLSKAEEVLGKDYKF
jgi:SecD/SecF fusion protein